MGGCCNQTTKGPKKKYNGGPNKDRTDTLNKVGLTMRKVILKKQAPKIDEVLFMHPEEVLQWIDSSTVNQKKEHLKFIEMIHKNDFTELYKLVGHDEVAASVSNGGLPFLELKSGRLITSTVEWNPMIYAFVFGHTDLINYFAQNSSRYDLLRCLQVHQIFGGLSPIEPDEDAPEDDEFALQKRGFHNLLALMVENHSPGLFALLDSFSFLVTFDDIVHIFQVLAQLPCIPDSLEIKQQVFSEVLDSQAFKSIYCQTVTMTGYESFEGSFQAFFERVFHPVLFERVELMPPPSGGHPNIFIRKIEEHFKKAPFNAGFGMYLYLSRNQARSNFPFAENLLKDITSSGLRDFDVFRLTEGLSPEEMKDIESESIKVAEKHRSIYQRFIKDFSKHFAKRKNIEDTKLLKAVFANNLEQVKKFVGQKEYSIPRVAVKTLFGYSAQEGIQLEFECSGQVEIIETDQMNPLELACVKGYDDILKYFILDLNLRSKDEFHPNSERATVEELHFIFVPIVKKHAAVFELLMNIPSLWSYEELRQISIFLKQAKWREGFQIFFQSTAVKVQFKRLALQDRFRFIRDCLMLPYMVENIPFEVPASCDENHYDEMGNFIEGAESIMEESIRQENNLTDEEQRLFYITIKDCLCEMPFACAMVLHIFQERTRQTYVVAAGYNQAEDLLSMEAIDERVITLQMCNNVITDSVLNEYIQFLGGGDQLLVMLHSNLEWQGEFNSIAHNESQFKVLKEKYAEQMKIFMDRIKDHPSMKEIGVKQQEWQPDSSQVRPEDIQFQQAQHYGAQNEEEWNPFDSNMDMLSERKMTYASRAEH